METKSSDNSAFVWIAVPFLSLALTTGLVVHNWAMGLPFGVLALTFLVIGLSGTSTLGSRGGVGDGEGDLNVN
ncbi:MAG: ABC-type sugar transport system, permease component [Microbacterium sp.]|jgi:hypothetical protein|nr:ABC-type sugar transport system, permease component [Microbacterium sp.]